MPGPVLVLCLGNDLRRDDGVGWAVASALGADPPANAVVRCSALSGLHLLDELEGHEHVIVVDAIATGRHPPGTVLEGPLASRVAGGGPSPHAFSLPAVLAIGRRTGLALPSRIDVVAVEVGRGAGIGEGLGVAVRRAVPRAAAAVSRLIRAATNAAGQEGSRCR